MNSVYEVIIIQTLTIRPNYVTTLLGGGGGGEKSDIFTLPEVTLAYYLETHRSKNQENQLKELDVATLRELKTGNHSRGLADFYKQAL